MSDGPTLVDSNVLIDVATEDSVWGPWSTAALEDAARGGPLAINPIIYGEVSVGFKEMENLDRRFPSSDFARLPLPWAAAFLAGKVFFAYRRAGGPRPSPLPDFYIGAHAAVDGLPLLTRDPSRYRTYFPGLVLIAP